MTEETLYWITRMDEIKNSLSYITVFFVIVIVISLISFVISYIGKCVEEKYRSKEYLKNDEDYILACKINKTATIILLLCIPLWFITFTTNTLTPTTKDYVAIKIVPAIVNNEKLKNISNDFVDVAEQWLKDLKETKNIH
jgi:hypothetical protein